MATIYRKTRIGQAEIQTRALRLQPRLRNLLIMVDGKRDVNALQALLAYAPEAALQELMAYGLIDVVQQRAPAAALAGADSMPSSQHSTLDGAALLQLRKDAVRALNDALGPAAETTAIGMERARSEADLRPLLERAANLIAAVKGSAAGRAYAERFLNKP